MLSVCCNFSIVINFLDEQILNQNLYHSNIKNPAYTKYTYIFQCLE